MAEKIQNENLKKLNELLGEESFNKIFDSIKGGKEKIKDIKAKLDEKIKAFNDQKEKEEQLKKEAELKALEEAKKAEEKVEVKEEPKNPEPEVKAEVKEFKPEPKKEFTKEPFRREEKKEYVSREDRKPNFKDQHPSRILPYHPYTANRLSDSLQWLLHFYSSTS